MRRWYDISDMANSEIEVHISKSPTAQVTKYPDGTWRLEIPADSQRGYRIAQLDDHGSRRRSDFRWQPPLQLSLQARVSAHDLLGTWGFGLWNDPFSLMIAYVGLGPRLPTLPDAAWFFHASPQNYLSFRDDLPANGFLAATFHSKKIPAPLLALGSPLLAFTLIPRAARVVRRLIHRLVPQDAASITTDVTTWHAYSMQWTHGQVSFSLDGREILQTNVAPSGPLSLVIWIDNQYASLPPRDRFRYGTLPNPEPAWLEIKGLSAQKLA